MTAMMELDGLRKQFGSLVAVDGITFSVDRGEVLGFLGPNGAGKSTTMKMVAGFLTPSAGTARVAGNDVVTDPVSVKKTLGYLPEGAPAYGDMTPASFLDFVADVRRLEGDERRRLLADAVAKVDIGHVMDQPIETLSKGYKRRVGLAQAILHDPPVLILDEPTDGLDPIQKHQVRELIRGMAADKAVVISTHILEEVEAVCTRAIIISQGRIMADGTPDELLARSPWHNAIRVEVAQSVAETVRADITAVDGVARVETVREENGRTVLRALPEGAKPIAMDVGAMLSAKGHPVDSLHTERGALDEVFRLITEDNEPTEGDHA